MPNATCMPVLSLKKRKDKKKVEEETRIDAK